MVNVAMDTFVLNLEQISLITPLQVLLVELLSERVENLSVCIHMCICFCYE